MVRKRMSSPSVAMRRRQVLPVWVKRMDRAVARRVNRRRTPVHVDRAYQRLSHSADYGRLWLVLAAVLAVFGRHRAGIRGIASLSVASFLANLVGKKIFGGDRPLLKDVPVVRHLRKQPTSTSFPSGHSASAAAFATGVALESPKAGALIAPVAAGVIYSRLHVGAHWFSDVVGGAALGAAVAGIGKAAVPAKSSPWSAQIVAKHAELPACPSGDGVYIIVNRHAGAGPLHTDPAPHIADRLPHAVVRYVTEHEDVAAVARRALTSEHPPRVLGVCGGDGTVATAAHFARQAGLPLLVIPGGTFNHFARTAGVDTVDAAIDAVQRGTGVHADVAELTFGDEDPFTVVNAASVGLYADFVATREQHEKRWGKWVAAVIAAVKVTGRAEPVRVSIDGREASVWTLFVGVGKNYPTTTAPLQRRRLDDHVLDIRALHAGSRFRAVASLAFGRRVSAVLRRLHLVPGATAVESFRAEELTVTVHPRHGQPPGFAHDGEVTIDEPHETTPEGDYTTRIRVIPNGLQVYAPTSAGG